MAQEGRAASTNSENTQIIPSSEATTEAVVSGCSPVGGQVLKRTGPKEQLWQGGEQRLPPPASKTALASAACNYPKDNRKGFVKVCSRGMNGEGGRDKLVLVQSGLFMGDREKAELLNPFTPVFPIKVKVLNHKRRRQT